MVGLCQALDVGLSQRREGSEGKWRDREKRCGRERKERERGERRRET